MKICRSHLGFVVSTLLLIGTYDAASTAGAEDTDLVKRASREYQAHHAADIIQEFRNLLALPNVTKNQEDAREVAKHVVGMLSRRGLNAELLEADGANPVVYGEILVPNAQRTIVLYAHYDGQPVNASRWLSTPPFEPALYSNAIESGGVKIEWPNEDQDLNPDWRIYGRSTSDDKLPIIALVTAIDVLRENDLAITSNIKLFLDGEEEAGSPTMRTYLAKYSERYEDADLWVFLDGPLHQSRKPTVYFGVRGVCSMEITVYGARRNLHSGHYGNWAPNPALRLAQLLGGMKDENDRVVIPGFYESTEPLSEQEQQAINQVPSVDESLRQELGLFATENHNQLYIERMQLPSLNIRGFQSATVGETARNVVPNEAVASIDIRLVKGNEPRQMLGLVEDYIRTQGYHIVRDSPDQSTRLKHERIARIVTKPGYRAARTSMDDEAVAPVIEALSHLAGDRGLLRIPSLGGSLPLYLITDILQKPLIIVPYANHDNNQHAPDENLRIGNLLDAIDGLAVLLTL